MIKYRLIGLGFIIRILLSLIVVFLSINVKLKVILLLLLDALDCATSKIIGWFLSEDDYISYCKEYSYQATDKIVDLWSYYLIFILLRLESPFFIPLFIRTVGVLLMTITKESKYLVYFPDIFRELVVFNMFIPLNFITIITIIVLKTTFEFYWHNYVNKGRYIKK